MQEEERAAEADLSRQDPDRATRLWIRGHGAFISPPPLSPPQQQPSSKGPSKVRSEDPSKDEGKKETQVTALRPADAPDVSTVAQAQDLRQDENVGAGPSDEQEQPPSPSETGTDNASRRSAVASGRLADAASGAVAAGAAESDQQVRGGGGDGGGGGGGGGAEGGRSSPNPPDDDDDRGSGTAERVGVRGGVMVEDRAGEGRDGAVVPDFRLNGFVHVCPLVSEGCKFTVKAWLQDEDD